jgi:hypothetical protein
MLRCDNSKARRAPMPLGTPIRVLCEPRFSCVPLSADYGDALFLAICFDDFRSLIANPGSQQSLNLKASSFFIFSTTPRIYKLQIAEFAIIIHAAKINTKNCEIKLRNFAHN